MANARHTNKQQQVHLKVFTVLGIKYQNGSFVIGKARVEEGDQSLKGRQINFKGDFASIDLGRSYEAYGAIETHPRYGDSYKLSGVSETMPKDRLGVIRYLMDSYDLAFDEASMLVNAYGPELRGILDSATPEQLGMIGLNQDTAERLLARWNAAQGEHNIEKILTGVAGVGTKMLARIFDHFKNQGMRLSEVMEKNPYLLMQVPRVGWKIADAVAEQIGIEADDPRRLEAACTHLVGQEERNGHTWTGKDEILTKASEMLALPSHRIVDALMHQDRATDALLVIDEEQRCYTPEMLRTEQHLAEGLYRLMSSPSTIACALQGIEWGPIFERSEVKLTEEQQEAVQFLLNHKVAILTGGAGVGKSTVQRTVLAALEAAKVKHIRLCAPTGKAAKRLTETSGMQATTVHRLVAALENEHEDYQIPSPDFVIIDEASMLDTQVAEWLIAALPDQTHLVLVGDDNQLPSVGAGRVLYDCIQAGVPMTRLTKVLRQAGESLIIKTSHAINNGSMPTLSNGAGDDMFMFEVGNAEKVAEHTLRLITSAIPEKYGIEADEVTVIAPMYKHACGIIALNAELQAALNPPDFSKNEARWYDKTLREGDKLIWTSNNYELGLVNGEEVRVERIYQDRDDETGQHKTFVDLDMAAGVPLDELTATHGYAVTVHKAQGSEYKCAIVVAHSAHQFMLTRRLLYTAVTRGKELGIIIGERSAVQKAVGNVREDGRRTGLVSHLSSLLRDPVSEQGSSGATKGAEAMPEAA